MPAAIPRLMRAIFGHTHEVIIGAQIQGQLDALSWARSAFGKVHLVVTEMPRLDPLAQAAVLERVVSTIVRQRRGIGSIGISLGHVGDVACVVGPRGVRRELGIINFDHACAP